MKKLLFACALPLVAALPGASIASASPSIASASPSIARTGASTNTGAHKILSDNDFTASLKLTAAGMSRIHGNLVFTTLDNQADPTFNQLLGINNWSPLRRWHIAPITPGASVGSGQNSSENFVPEPRLPSSLESSGWG